MKLKPRKKLRSSLLTRFILIIAVALLFIPVLIPFSLLTSWGINRLLYPPIPIVENKIYESSVKLETLWHNEALALANSTPEEINRRLEELKQKYPDASLFWVDSEGTTRLQLPKQAAIPANWSIEDSIAFMKRSVDADPFTIVAFIGDNQAAKKGFMVFELPRRFMKQTIATSQPSDIRIYLGLFSLMLISFILLSYLFFRDIRRRLLRLEAAMTYTGENGVPTPIQEGRPDEIGRLETAFNNMVNELNDSRMREHEEEELRKSLISNLSHDLRTPLTVLASHLYSISKEPLSEQGQKSLSLMETKIGDLDGLIDHLLSYNLLSTGRYSLSLKKQDILRIVRESAAAWYPVWEKSRIEADISLPDEYLHWNVDEQGLRRVLDNLFQNLVRHASTGGYVGISITKWQGRTALVISDHGPGMGSSSPAKGAGLGLPIVDLLLREMGLIRDTESSSAGTSIYIYPV